MHTRIFSHASTSPRCAPIACAPVRTHRRCQHVVRCSSTPSNDQTAAPVQQVQPVAALQADGWDYKYPHLPCATLCDPADTRGMKLEALFQHVLGYPRLPARVCQYLPQIPTDINTMTLTVEGLSRRYGREIVLYFLRRNPNILHFDLDTLVSRAEHVRSMLDLRPSELLMILRKNPNLFIMDPSLMRTRYTALHKIMPLNHDSVRRMVHKYPLILNFQTTSVESLMDSLRQLSYTRVQWQQDFDALTPSLLAYYFRDARDLLSRLEYLVTTGESAHADITQLFKMSNNMFAKRHRQFRPWLQMREQRRQQQLLRQSISQQAADSIRLSAASAKQPGAAGQAQASAPHPATLQQGRQAPGAGAPPMLNAAAVAQQQAADQGQQRGGRRQAGK